MLVKTRGIVLKFIKFRETSIIVSVYTESFGIQHYIVNSVRSVRSKKNKIALYQPLTILDLVVYHRESSSLQRLSESRCIHPFCSITLDAKKTAIALFIVEILSKTLKEQTENQELFNFIRDSIIQFDENDFRSENFHLIFIIKLTRFLGFSPRDSAAIQNELKNSLESRWLQTEEARLLNQMLNCDYTNTVKITNQQRTEILRILLSFYQLHVEQFGLVKSVKVLNQVFS